MSEEHPERLEIEDLRALFGLEDPGLVAEVPGFEALPALCYRPLERQERDDVLLRVLEELERKELQASGVDRHPDWERGWGEILARVERAGPSYSTLKPQYFRHPVMRLSGDYVAVPGARFEHALSHLLKAALYRGYLRPDDRVIELGCGTGANLYQLLRMFPSIEAIGCDWAEASQRILGCIAEQLGVRLEGRRLDLFDPAGALGAAELEGAVALSVHAFEQLGARFGPILDRLVQGRPRLCIHIEPVEDFYDPEILLDQLALRYHRRRSHLTGFWPALKKLESEGRIEILEARRIPVGNLYHEPYSVLVWRPLESAR